MLHNYTYGTFKFLIDLRAQNIYYLSSIFRRHILYLLYSAFQAYLTPHMLSTHV